jgi:DNA-directed RNA polymerase subunit F
MFVFSSTENALDYLERMYKITKPKKARDLDNEIYENDSLPFTPGL